MFNAKLLRQIGVISLLAAAVFFLAGCAAEYEIELKVQPEGAGKVTGEGLYEEGVEVVLEAEAEKGYEFVKWKENGKEISTDASYVLEIEDDKKLTAHFREKTTEEIAEFLAKAGVSLEEKEWREAGEHLEKATEQPGAEEVPTIARINQIKNITVDVVEALKNEEIVTRDHIVDGIEELEKVQPSRPDLEVLEKDSEELYSWFQSLSEWRSKLQMVPVEQEYSLFLEEGIEEIYSTSEGYLQEPVSLFYLDTIEINNNTLYFIIPTGYEQIRDVTFLLIEMPELTNIEVKEDRVVITLRLDESIEHPDVDISPGEYQIMYDLYVIDDNTFRVGDYYIKDMETGDILKEGRF